MKKDERRLITSPKEVQAEMKRLTRRGFLVGGVSVVAAVAGWQWIRSQPKDNGAYWPLREGLEFNHRIVRELYDPRRLARTFEGPPDAIPRINGDLGLEQSIDLDAWRLRVENLATPGGTVELAIDEIRALPRTQFITYLMCIEGWSDMGHWSGIRFSDFLMAYPPATRSGRPVNLNDPADLPRYVGFETPDRGYYVGIDMPSALQPQTVLCDEMGGVPLTSAHGAPLRLYTPVKYGIKSLKRIGRIYYSDERPPDYWAMRGYDYYAGL